MAEHTVRYADTVKDIADRAKADQKVIVVAVLPDGSWGVAYLAPDFWTAETPDLVGPELVRLFRDGHDELVREGGPLFVPPK